jgi:transposase
MGAWLQSCGIETVVVQATGVYRVVLSDVLEAAGLKVWVVNARGTKNLPGRKSDVQECEWLRRLHAYGLLRNSYRPPEQIRGLRDLWRLCERWVQDAGRAVQQMQKAMVGMNLQLTHALSDISGVTGMAIIRAILAGQRNPWELAKLRDPRVQASEEEIAHSLEGTWREELVFDASTVSSSMATSAACPGPSKWSTSSVRFSESRRWEKKCFRCSSIVWQPLATASVALSGPLRRGRG